MDEILLEVDPKTKHYLRKIIILLLLLLLGGYAWLHLHFLFGDDLIIDLTQNQTSFRITNIQDASVSVTLSTRNQLLCTAQCDFSLINVSTQEEVAKESFLLRPGEEKTKEFNLEPGSVGSGQVIYSVAASCHNIKTFICPSSSPERRKTVLLTVNYALSTQESEIKPWLKTTLEEMLQLLKQTDIAMQELNQFIVLNPRVHKNGIVVNITKAQDAYYAHHLFLEEAKGLWSKQAYVPLYNRVQQENITLETMNATFSFIEQLKTAFSELEGRHNELKVRLDTTQLFVQQLFREQPLLANDASYARAASILVNTTNSLHMVYVEDGFLTYELLNESIEQLLFEAQKLNNSVPARIQHVINYGNNLSLQERRSLCILRNDCQLENGVVDTISERCTLFRQHEQKLALADLQFRQQMQNAASMYQQNSSSVDQQTIAKYNLTDNRTHAFLNNKSLLNNLTQQYPELFEQFLSILEKKAKNETIIEVLNTTVMPESIFFYARNATLFEETLDYTQRYCFVTENSLLSQLTLNTTPLLLVIIVLPENITSSIEVTLSEHLPQCCVFADCKPCCNTDACRDDPESYPVVFVHGHAFNAGNSPEYSLGGYFSKIQQRLQQDGYLDAGIVTPSSSLSEVDQGEWGLSGRPVTARVTYYYNFYKIGSEYVIITQKSENIETYAIRLKELIDIVKHHTGKSKVNIVAHSMGGLVVRRYIQIFGEDAVNTVVLIGTPNNGITEKTKTLCPVFGESKECDDMTIDSVFMRKLNDPSHQPTKISVYTIAGTGCNVGDHPGDGVVETVRVNLTYATNHVVKGSCTDFFKSELHERLLDVEKYPVVYEYVKEALKS